MAWRVAKSLDVLLAQLDEAAPNRSKVSDGSIGDQSHSSRTSDHNPNLHGVVTARDFTHDPDGGLDCHQLAVALDASRDRRIKYVIWNRQIMSSTVSPWTWRPYTGSNPHTKHLHLSVAGSPEFYDDPSPWRLDGLTTPTAQEDDDMTPEQDRLLRQMAVDAKYARDKASTAVAALGRIEKQLAGRNVAADLGRVRDSLAAVGEHLHMTVDPSSGTPRKDITT